MKKHIKNIIVALVCFLVVVVLNFLLPRMVPGDPVAYLAGFDEEDFELNQEEYDYYKEALHLNDSLPVQFGYYLQSLVDGTLGYSYAREATVASIIAGKVGYTLQISLPGVLLSALIGLAWGLKCGLKKGSVLDKVSTSALIVINAVPTFLIAILLLIFCCFKHRWFPYMALNSENAVPGTLYYFFDRMNHLFLPILTLTIAAVPSRFLIVRNTASKISNEKYVLYARQRGLPEDKIEMSYVFKNIAQPFITMLGMSVGTCIGGSVIVERMFSIYGMGGLLNQAVNGLDYPLIQGILFVTTFIMTVSIIVTDIICIIIDPKVRLGEDA